MDDKRFMLRAIELALLAEEEGNLPVGAVIVLGNKVIAEGRNVIFIPTFDATRHAEMETLRAVPEDLWKSAGKMSLYTSLEPCLMCFSSILLHGVGRVVFGSSDPYGGAGRTLGNLPPYFKQRFGNTEWVGPLMPEDCDPLYERILTIEGVNNS